MIVCDHCGQSEQKIFELLPWEARDRLVHGASAFVTIGWRIDLCGDCLRDVKRRVEEALRRPPPEEGT